MEPAASFASLTAGLVQDILRHLDLKGQGRAACVSKLCASAVLPLAPALAHYVTAGDAPAVRRLLSKPDARLGLDNPSCEYGRTPLLAAVVQNNPDIFAALLEAGAATEPRNTDGFALNSAASLGRTSMVEALLAAGAAVEAEDKYGGRPLHLAAVNGHASIVEALLAAGAELEAEDKNGWRPLHCAAAHGQANRGGAPGSGRSAGG